MSAATIFMKLTLRGQPLKGDVTVPGFEDRIAVDSCSWSNKADHRSIGPNVRKTTLTPGHLKFGKVFDRSSTALYMAMKQREKLESCLLTLVDVATPNERLEKLLEIEVMACQIESISTRASEAGSVVRVGEDFALSFESGRLTYYFPANPSLPGRSKTKVYQIEKSG